MPAGGELHLGSAADPIANLRIAYNDAGAGTATANLDFSATNPTFTAFISGDLSIGRETGAANFAASAANGSLILGSNSTITLGSTAAPATLNIGWSQNLNSGGRRHGSATGVFDALTTGAALDLHLSELNVGRGSLRGVGTGTLKWNQTEVIDAPDVYFGRGNATGILEVPAGGELHLGSAADPIANLRIAYNDAGAGTATANLDFSATNPTFTAFISGDLSIGRETGAATFAAIAANGSLILGSNSTITLGSTAAPATLNIGWSQNLNSGGGANGSATGVLDTTQGSSHRQAKHPKHRPSTANLGTATEPLLGAGASHRRQRREHRFRRGASGTLDVLADALILPARPQFRHRAA